MATPMRYVAYSRKRGVFLGWDKARQKFVFGNDEGVTAEYTAPTFQDREELEKHIREASADKTVPGKDSEALIGSTLFIVFPRGDEYRAGPAEVSNSGLPAWGGWGQS